MDLSSRIATLTPDQRRLFNLRLRHVKPQLLKLQPIPRRDGDGPALLSYEQERLWFIQQLFPDAAGFNISTIFHFREALDIAAVASSFAEVVRRHEILRTAFVVIDGEPRQVVAPEARLRLAEVDLRGLSESRRVDEMMRWLGPLARRPFNLAAGEPLRIALFHTGDEAATLLLTVHHIVTDWWSFNLIEHELAALYEDYRHGRPSSLPPLPIQFADFAIWQREWMRGEAFTRQLEFWRRQLAGAPTQLELPADRPRPATPSFRGARQPVRLARGVVETLKVVDHREESSLFSSVATGLAVLLSRWSGQEEILFGTPVSDRSRPETEALIGYFLNLLILRVDVRGRPAFRQLVERVRGVVQEAYANQDLPFGKLLDDLGGERTLNRNPLFQVAYVYIKNPDPASAPPETSPDGVPVFDPGTTRVDMTLVFEERALGIHSFIEYSREIFDTTTIARLAGQLERLLAGAAADPGRASDDLELLSVAERWCLVGEWNDTVVPRPRDLFAHQLVMDHGRRAPDAVALTFGDQCLTYGELARRSGRLARRLRRVGVGRGSLVGLGSARSPELIVTLLAVLEAGGAYLPLDLSYPRERLALMLGATGAAFLLIGGGEADAFQGLVSSPLRTVHLDEGDEEDTILHGDGAEPVARLDPDDLAYVLFTSGSTGRPKGVEIPHGALLNFLLAARRTLGLTDRDVLLAISSLSFDASVLDLFLPLIVGARMDLLAREEVTDGTALARRLEENGATVLLATAGPWRMLLDAGWQGGHLRALTGGEVLSLPLAAALGERVGELWNIYGPTETTVASTFWRVELDDQGPVPLGRPLDNTRIHVLDAEMRPVPAGVAGELYIGGTGVARGYRGRPDLTAERFVPDPMGTPGGRLYRTGDRGCRRCDGVLAFHGRLDHQIKVRGYRIEPGEVEAALLLHPAVGEAAVLAAAGDSGLTSLVAWVAPPPGMKSPVAGELRDFLTERLPAQMVPSLYAFLEALPRTPVGKVDRRELASRKARAEPAAARTAMRTPTEEVVAALWTSLLGIPHVGADDDFFLTGGNSLLGFQLVVRVRQALGVELPLRALFETPSVAQLAARIDCERRRGQSIELPPLAPLSRPDEIPLSFAQQRLWFIEQLEPGSAVYNTPFFLRLTGALDVVALASAFAGVVERHEVLRTTFVAAEGNPAVQVIGSRYAPGLPVIDLGDLVTMSSEAEARRLAALEAARPFDLRCGPVLRTTLLRLAEAEHVLVVNAHHIATDAWSLEILWREVAALYDGFRQGRPAALPPLPVQYADFAIWQRGWLGGKVLEAQLGYWRSRLGDLPVVELPVDRPRPAVQSYRGADLPLALPLDASVALSALSRREGATPFMTLLALFVALLGRITGQRDLPVGTPISGRRELEVEGLVGFFLNTLVIRAGLPEGITFRRLVGQLRGLALEAYSHQDLPFEKLVDELSPQRSLSHSPLFQVFFVLLHQTAGTEVTPEGLAVAPFQVEREISRFDLMLSLDAGGEAFSGTLEYATDLFDRPTIARLAAHLGTLAAAVTAAPDGELSALPLFAAAERHQLLMEWNDTARPLPEPSLYQSMERQAERAPDAVALRFGDHWLSYGELALRSARLARCLWRLGVGPESRVGVGLDRSPEMAMGVLGVLAIGAAYVPVDPELPRERRDRMLEDARVEILLTRRGLLAEMSREGVRSVCLDLPIPEGPEFPPGGPPTDPDCLAYILFTSGSTGTPKGVALPRRALENLIDWHLRHSLGGARTLQIASLSFDVSFLEMFACWGSGGTLLLLSEELRRDVPALADFLVEAEAEKAMFPVVLLQRLAEEYAGRGFRSLPPLAEIISLGEQLQTSRVMGELLRNLRSCTFYNYYGPSESHLATAYTLDADPAGWVTHPPIGLPIANTRVHLLDDRFAPVPVGVPGELAIGGVCLARGYAGRPDLTAERFIPDPFADVIDEPGSRLYLTGDKVRRLPGGPLDFLGRFDHQVKVRGFRVEPEEIESVLGGCPGVRQAVVLARQVSPGDTRLIAFLVSEPGGVGAPGIWRALLREKLPDYMVPSHFVILDALPLNANGKVDRRALLAHGAALAETERPDLAATYLGPCTAIEETLAAIWGDVLGIERVGVDDDFFELGGHSLLATQAVSRVRQALAVDMPLRTLFKNQTVRAFAKQVEELRREKSGQIVPPLRPAPRGDRIPLSFAQQRLWFIDQ
ncbi:MAG TPA: amino acid adenylation domain-containing protein, partial [Thermoanaerobaculia bacterium]|nr:amino acid adenylation domain-containing protein [Thermoanaerobaculia bacterium]